MRTMYDSVVASNIPRNAEMVAGYVDPDGTFTWSEADWALFPNAVKVRIAGHSWTNDGHVLDVETGDATPDQAPGWVNVRRRAGLVQPSVYCSLAVWDECELQFREQGVAEPEWWIAAYPGNGTNLYDGAVAHQYIDVGPYDLSVVADYWPGVDEAKTTDPIPTKTKKDEDMWIAYVLDKTWCDVYYAGVLVDGFRNNDNPNQFGVGGAFQRYINLGVPWTLFKTEADYSATRTRLSNFATK